MKLDPANALSVGAQAGLRRDAAASPGDEAKLRKVAQQFESLMTQQILKASRSTALGEELMGGAGLDLYKDMFDQQMAQQISSGKGLGLADVLVQQLRGSKTAASAAINVSASPLVAVAQSSSKPVDNAPKPALTDRISRFVDQLWQQAEQAAKALGLPTEAVVGHAALETGWGAHLPGGDSHNLFGIKADRAWRGAKVAAETTEMDGGQSRRERAEFRAYGAAAEGLADYVQFLKGNPRYAQALQHGGSPQQFAEGLQKAGYATDPRYAEKLKAAIARAADARAQDSKNAI